MGSLGNVDCIVILIVRIFEFVRMNHGSLKIIYFELKLKFAILKKRKYNCSIPLTQFSQK